MTKFIQFVCLIALLNLINCESCRPISPEDVDFIFIKDFDYHFIRVNLNNAEKVLENSSFNKSKKTIIYAFDFLETSDSLSTQIITYPFLKRDDFNVIVLDYGKFSSDNYFFDAVPNAIKIGKLLAKTLIRLNENFAFDIKKVLLVGFSLGAHLMGQVGRSLSELSNDKLKISQIVGLDPSSPAFYPLNPYVVALNKNDAEFVQIIHTDTTNFGIPVATAHSDFWPNEGKNQPKCPSFDKDNIFKTENQCSHLRSVEYYAESVFKKNIPDFHAISCQSWDDFKSHNCYKNRLIPVTNMGFLANPNVSGNFYLRTNEQPKFSRGSNGVFFIDNIFDLN